MFFITVHASATSIRRTDSNFTEWLDDVDVQDTNVETVKTRREDKTLDVSAFFGKPYSHKAKDAKTRTVRDCEPCKWAHFNSCYIFI